MAVTNGIDRQIENNRSPALSDGSQHSLHYVHLSELVRDVTEINEHLPSKSLSEVLSLVAKMEKRAETEITQPKEWPELMLLKDKCGSVNIFEIFAAFRGFVELVEKKILTGSKTLSLLMSTLNSVNYYTPLVMAVGDILLLEIEENGGQSKSEYNFNDKLHPFAIILKYDTVKAWNSVFHYMQHLLENEKNIKMTTKIQLLKPTLLYVFINPDYKSSQHKTEVIDLLLEHVEEPEITFLIFELISWHNVDMNYCKLIKKIAKCFLNSPREEERKEVIASLIPYLAETVKWLIISANNPLTWIDLLSKSLEITKDGSSAVLFLLSDIFQETPVCFINRLAEVCTSIIYSCSCNKYMAYNFLASSLLWMVNPTPAEETLLKTLEHVTKFLAYKCETSDWSTKTIDLNANPYFKIIKNSISDVKYAIDMAIISDSWNDKASLLKWMNSLFTSNYAYVQATLQSLVAGIILSEDDDELLDVCVEILLNTTTISFNMCYYCICLMFYKLCRESEPKRQLKYLRSLTQMVETKEAMPLVVGIIELIRNKGQPTIWPVVIDLYLMIWRKDKRIYPYLQKALFACPTDSENSWELNTMKSLAIRELCETSPDVHGKGLVSKLSDVLNNSDKCESGTPTAIAIEAVIELCDASVIDIWGTWKTLKPKLSHDTRPEVIVRLCMLFSKIPALTSPGSGWNELVNDVIPRLWDYAFSENMQVVKAALASLAKFGPGAYGPKLLPDILKKDVVLSREHFKESKEMSKDQLLDHLEYIPGECWIELLHKVDPRVRKEAGNMLIGLIDKELRFFPRRFFCLGETRPEPENYEHLPLGSVCRAAEQHIKDYLNKLNPEQKHISWTVTEILRVFSTDYCKLLPHLNWTFLTKFLTFNGECKRHAILILVKQAGSKGGKKIFEKYIVDNLRKYNDVNEFMFLYSILPQICTYLGPNILRHFLEKTIRTSFHSSLHAGTDDFENVLKAAAEVFDGSFVPETRKPLLAAQLQNILALIPPEHELLKVYANYAHLLPTKTYECITCPSYWPQITSEKIRQSLTIRVASIIRPDAFQFISSFNDLLDTVCQFPSESEVFICSIMEVLQKIRNLNHTVWFLELLLKMESSSSNLSLRGSVAVTLFYLDLFIISVITVVGYDFLLLDKDQHVIKSISHKLFPNALHKFLSWSEYAVTGPKVLECIYNLSKWTRMPPNYVQVLEQALFVNRANIYCINKGKWKQFLYIPMKMKFE